eukprot:5048196-Prymnesium_polylepis.1
MARRTHPPARAALAAVRARVCVRVPHGGRRKGARDQGGGDRTRRGAHGRRAGRRGCGCRAARDAWVHEQGWPAQLGQGEPGHLLLPHDRRQGQRRRRRVRRPYAAAAARTAPLHPPPPHEPRRCTLRRRANRIAAPSAATRTARP